MADEHEKSKKALIFGVGYKQPPVHTRFQKGQSGNPKGRPPRKTTVAFPAALEQQPILAALLRAANKPVTVREGEQVREISTREALVQAVIVSAVKGSPRAQAEALKWIQAADAAHASEIEERKTFWSEYKAEKTEELAKAREEGKPAPSILPHPEDIVIDHESGPRFLGPISEECQARVDQTIAQREVLIMQDALDERSTKRLDGEPLTEPGSAILLAMALDKSLPPRLQLSQSDWVWWSGKYDRLPKRDLLKRLFREWRKVGRPLPRGYVFPNRKDIVPHLKFSFALTNAIVSESINPQHESREQVEEKLISLMEESGLTPV